MDSGLIYLLGTLAGWAGWGFLFAGVIALVNQGPVRKTGLLFAAAAVGLGLAAQLPLAGPKELAFYRLPIAWPVMPFPVWLAVLALGMFAWGQWQMSQAVTDDERRARLSGSMVWGLIFVGALVWLYVTPNAKIEILRGAIPFSAATLGFLVTLLLGSAAAMAASARYTAGRNAARTAVTQAALIAGGVVFGLPFVYLLITSFKEDRDMSSPNGIVWVPRVSETRPYLDPKNPLYATTFNGSRVEATILEEMSDGRVTLDVFRPLSIRGTTFTAEKSELTQVPRAAPVVTAKVGDEVGTGLVIEELDNGRRRVQFDSPASLAGQVRDFAPTEVEPVRNVGLRTQNYTDALEYLPPETAKGLVYLRNTLLVVVLSVVGTVLSSSLVAYAFSRMQFPGRDTWFGILLATMMLPAAVTLLPQFLIFRSLGWIDTLYPLWVPAFFASAFNVFLLRQFFKGIPMELEDAAKIDGCTYLKTFWSIMLPQIKPALAVIAIWTFMGAWNNFMGPLIYVNSPENMPLSYALQLFQGDRSGEPGLLMAFATMTMLPVLLLFFFMQKYFIEGVTLSGLGGR
jgi:multiple sugar transport system permease protein